MSRAVLIIFCALGFLTVANTVFIGYTVGSRSKIVVIDIMRTVNEFEMKKDLEQRVAAKLGVISQGIDSIAAVKTAMQNGNASQSDLAIVSANLDTLTNQGQRAYLISNQRINEQVWQRLNSLLTEYGERHGYKLVIGANGMGTVLYNEKAIDKTDELIAFINSRYAKGR